MPTGTERVLAAYRAFNDGDLDGWLEPMHPDAELTTAGVFPGLDLHYQGREGMAKFWRQIHEPWESFQIDIEQVDEYERGLVLAVRFRAKGAGSGVDVDMLYGHAVRMADGLAVEIIARPSPEEAAEVLAAG
jgi:ketosteroid isomerase-like protein